MREPVWRVLVYKKPWLPIKYQNLPIYQFSTKIVYLTLRVFLRWAILSMSFTRIAQHNHFISVFLWLLVGIVCLLCVFCDGQIALIGLLVLLR